MTLFVSIWKFKIMCVFHIIKTSLSNKGNRETTKSWGRNLQGQHCSSEGKGLCAAETSTVPPPTWVLAVPLPRSSAQDDSPSSGAFATNVGDLDEFSGGAWPLQPLENRKKYSAALPSPWINTKKYLYDLSQRHTLLLSKRDASHTLHVWELTHRLLEGTQVAELCSHPVLEAGRGKALSTWKDTATVTRRHSGSKTSAF